MDKKKIFILTFLLFFFHSQAFADNIIYNFSNKQAHYEDSNKNISNININFYKNINNFNYYLIAFNKNYLEQEPNNQKKKFIDFNKPIFFKMNDNIVMGRKKINELNKNYETIVIDTKELDLNNKNLKEFYLNKQKDNYAIYKYYLNRLNKDYVSDFYFKKDRNKIIMQKVDNKYIKSNNFYLFFLTSNPINFPEKINIRYFVETVQKKTYRGLHTVNLNKENFFEIEKNKFIYFAKVELFNDENLLNSQNNIIINETIFFFNSSEFSFDYLSSYEIFEIKNNIKYYILINNKYILLPDGLRTEEDKKLFFNENNILKYFKNESSIQKTINLESFKLKKWGGKLESLIELLADNENNQFLYIQDLESKAQPSSIGFTNIIIKYLILTPIYLFLIIFSLARNFVIKKSIFDFIFKSGAIIIISLFLLNIINQIFMINYNIYLLPFIDSIEFLLGCTLFLIYIIISVTKKINKD